MHTGGSSLYLHTHTHTHTHVRTRVHTHTHSRVCARTNYLYNHTLSAGMEPSYLVFILSVLEHEISAVICYKS